MSASVLAMSGVLRRAVVGVVMVALVLFGGQLVAAWTASPIVGFSPPVLPQFLIVVLLASIALAVVQPGLLRRVLLLLTIASGLLAALTGYGLAGFFASAPESVCSYLYLDVPEEIRATMAGLPEMGTDASVTASIRWPGDVVCEWRGDPAEYPGSSYSVPALVAAKHLLTWWR